ncbi:uncharacterized protein LOC133871556 [Alnus glutinosa]|uniref:uncharacterized protein LOC133871556 n=1 Tax=Alnus glutinosa TaxID=3517 RepID=UPI002D78F39D|nr:uncharacterized protein LOC133871556 [Alnus glutinosa]
MLDVPKRHFSKTLERGKIKFPRTTATAQSLSLSQISVRTARPSPVAGRPSSVSSPSGRQILSSSLSLSPAYFLSPALPTPPETVVRRLPPPADPLQLSLSPSGASRSARFGRPSSSPSDRSSPALSLSLRRFSSLRRSLSASGVRPSLRRSLSASGVLCRPADLVPVQLCLRQIFSPSGRGASILKLVEIGRVLTTQACWSGFGSREKVACWEDSQKIASQ